MAEVAAATTVTAKKVAQSGVVIVTPRTQQSGQLVVHVLFYCVIRRPATTRAGRIGSPPSYTRESSGAPVALPLT